VRTSNNDFKNYYSDALINVLSIWRKMSSSIAVTPTASHQDKNLLIRRCCGKIFLQSGQLKFHTCIHLWYTYWGEDLSAIYATSDFSMRTNSINTTQSTLESTLKFVCDDSFVPATLKDTNTSVSPTKCTEY